MSDAFSDQHTGIADETTLKVSKRNNVQTSIYIHTIGILESDLSTNQTFLRIKNYKFILFV